MKHIFLIAVFGFALACGGFPHEAPVPAGPPAGPGIAIAPDGVSIAYTVSGSGSPALVFVHGWMGDQTYWTDQAASFSDDHTVVTIDLAGHGESGMDREGWPLMAFGADVEAVIEALDLDPVILVGHSMGGAVVLEAARLMPDRVIGVIGVDSLHDAEAKYDPDQMKGYFAAYEADFVGTCVQMVTSMFQEDADPALVERVTNDMCDGSPEISLALLREFIEYEMGPALAAVAEIPVQYINSDSYPTNPEANQKYHPTFSGVIVQDVGHLLMIERPEEFNALLEQIITNLNELAI